MADILQAQTDNETNDIVEKFFDYGSFKARGVHVVNMGDSGGGGTTPGGSSSELFSTAGALYTTNWTTVFTVPAGEKWQIVYIKVVNKREKDVAVFSRWDDASQPDEAEFVLEGPVWVCEGDVAFLGVGQVLEEGDRFDLRNEPADSFSYTVIYRKLTS